MVEINHDFSILSATKLKKHKVQNWVNADIFLNILDSQEAPQKFWNTVSFHLLKLAAFKISDLKILKLCFKHFICSNV